MGDRVAVRITRMHYYTGMKLLKNQLNKSYNEKQTNKNKKDGSLQGTTLGVALWPTHSHAYTSLCVFVSHTHSQECKYKMRNPNSVIT